MKRQKLILAFLFLCYSFFSQTPKNKEIYKEYETKTDKSGNVNAVLILYADNTFINYGAENSNNGTDIWYTSGRWLGNNEIIMCRTNENVIDQKKLLADVADVYIFKAENSFTINNPNFRKLNYLNYTFKINEEGLSDKTVGIQYFLKK